MDFGELKEYVSPANITTIAGAGGAIFLNDYIVDQVAKFSESKGISGSTVLLLDAGIKFGIGAITYLISTRIGGFAGNFLKAMSLVIPATLLLDVRDFLEAKGVQVLPAPSPSKERMKLLYGGGGK